MAKNSYVIENVYQGGYDSFKPTYGDVFTGYRVAASELGMTTNPMTANQIQELNTSLNQGVIPIEVGTISPDHFDQIPKQHFEEMRRMAQLTGAKISLHAPIQGMEPSGISEQGWSESARQQTERRLTDVMMKASELDKNGNMPVTIHASNTAGSEYYMTPEGKKIGKLVVVNVESGKPEQVLEEETSYYPHKMHTDKLKSNITQEDINKVQRGEMNRTELFEPISLSKGETKSPEKRLEILNNSKWDQEITQLIFNKERGDEILQKNFVQIQHVMQGINDGSIDRNHLSATQQQALQHLENAETYLKDNQMNVAGLFNKAYKYGTDDSRKKLLKISESFQKSLENDPSLPGQSRAVHHLLLELGKPEVTPDMFVPIDKFVLEKSAKTFANVAFNSYDKFKEKAPIVSIENMYPGMGPSMKKEGEGGLPGMEELIVKSREQFVERAMKSKSEGGAGLGENEAKKQAERMIGMTFDVGHLNIAKKHGFKDEDLRKEAQAIAKYVKHVHLTDNFGYSDSHLPPGMGNVPIKELLGEMEKAGFSGRKILETGGWFEHFKTSPYALSLQAMGSPIYAMDMAPYWNQTLGLQQGYSEGFGTMLPSTHYQTFGAGFSQLPTELGGQVAGGQGSRMSGQGME